MSRTTDLLIRVFYFAGAVILLAAAASCSPDDNAYSEFETMPGAEWLYTDSLSFTPRATADSLVEGSLVVAVRHTRGYRYSNIWLEVAYPRAGAVDSADYCRDTIDLRLADGIGRWLGRGSGASFLRADTAVSRMTLRRGAPLRVRHIMRLDTLADIEQVGIEFIPVRKK